LALPHETVRANVAKRGFHRVGLGAAQMLIAVCTLALPRVAAGAWRSGRTWGA